jgi:HK97 gp10 family phage protein
MERLGQAIGARAQRLVPKRTWALHDTISTKTTVNGAKVTTIVGAGSAEVDYALHVERGTSRAAAQPYLRPALAQTRASDLLYSGRGITQHGVTPVRPSRRRRSR